MQRWFGPVLVGIGALIAVVGVVGAVDAGGEAVSPALVATQIAAGSSTTTEPTTTTRAATTTTRAVTTTTQAATTTTQPVSTTTTATPSTVPNNPVEEFIRALSRALDDGDSEFVFGRLHPAVIAGWGEDLCSAWVDRDIMALSAYTFLALVDGPLARVVDTPNGRVTVPDYYTATVSYTFQGETSLADSGFALVGTEMHWLGQCR